MQGSSQCSRDDRKAQLAQWTRRLQLGEQRAVRVSPDMKTVEAIEFTSRTRGVKAIIKQHELVENATMIMVCIMV